MLLFVKLSMKSAFLNNTLVSIWEGFSNCLQVVKQILVLFV